MKPALPIVLSNREWVLLGIWSRDANTPSRLRTRARIVLRAGLGETNQSIARALDVSPATVGLWRRRFAVHGLEGIRLEAPRPLEESRGARGTADLILQATREAPPSDRLRWTTRTLAKHLGLNHMQVYRVWKQHTLRSTQSVRARGSLPFGPWVDMLGTFQCPPVRAIVFGVNETGSPPQRQRFGGTSGGESEASTRVIYVPSPGTADLTWTLEELRGILPQPRVSVAGPHDLTIFLRSIERAVGSRTRCHLIVMCPDDEAREQLRRWLSRRPGFDSEILTQNSEWQAAVDRFLHTWGTRRLSPTSFRSIGRFTEALARFAADPASPSAAFTWVAP